MPADLPRKDVCNDKNVPEVDKLCKVRSDLKTRIFDSVKEDADRKGLFLFQFTTAEIYNVIDTTTVPENCQSKDSRVFVTYTCEQPADLLAEKQNSTSAIACCGVFLVLIYSTVIFYFKRHSNLNQLKWDIQTITPGDYTMQMEITPEMWNDFKEVSMSIPEYCSNGQSIVTNFKHYLNKEIVNILNKKYRDLKEEDNQKEREAEAQFKAYIRKYDGLNLKEGVKIADIVFAFDNAEMIDLLKKRGDHIMNNRYD
jgi:hypothetical protein